MKRNTLLLVFIIFIVLIILGVFYLVANNFNFFNESKVRTISASEFKVVKVSELKQLQERGLGAWEDVNLYIMDIRSREEYAQGHLVGSSSVPFEKAKERITGLTGVDIAIYSSASKLNEVQELVEIVKNNKSNDIEAEEHGTIYILSDGYEGLVEAGAATEAKRWD